MLRVLILATLALTAHSMHAQWDIQDSGTKASLRGIHSLGKGIAWASGTDGTVLRTEDGGYLWQRCTTPPGAEKLDFRGIQAFDNNTAIVMSSGKGDLSRLYKTTDGCQTWKLLFTNPDKDGFWNAIRFDGQDGWVLGDPVSDSFSLFTSSDSGLHWIKQRNLGLHAAANEQSAFAASNSVLLHHLGTMAFVAGGKAGSFFYLGYETEICVDECPVKEQNFDGAKGSWKKIEVPVGNKSESSGIFSLAARIPSGAPLPSATIISVGGDYLEPNNSSRTAAFSADGGQHWKAATTPPRGYRSAIAYDYPTKAWVAVGPNGTDISTDDGRNWRALKPGPGGAPDADKNWNALSLPFIVGPDGRIGVLRKDALAAK